MEKLSRDELQGVVAHEFSHILNGDMRLNVKLAAIVFGILVIGLIGGGILRGFGRGGVACAAKAAGAWWSNPAIGLAMLIIGYIGYFFGRLIQAAVPRQREFLADASAVQFTRNPGGITGALRKIGGYALGSHLATRRCRGDRALLVRGRIRPPAVPAGSSPPIRRSTPASAPSTRNGMENNFDPATIVDVRTESFQRVGYGPPPLPAEGARHRASQHPGRHAPAPAQPAPSPSLPPPSWRRSAASHPNTSTTHAV